MPFPELVPEPIPERVARFRTHYRATEQSRLYVGWAHLAFTSAGSLAAIATAIHHVRRPTWAELATVPIGFALANLVEYLGHKGPMHRPKRWLRLLFTRHTQHHHHFFTHDAMAYESSRDFQMVLFPPVMLLFFLGGIAVPLGAACFLLFSPNVGWLWVATAMGYFLSYEWLHFSYHLPRENPIARLPGMAALRRHHEAHHDQSLMGKWNFNITFPIADALFGTKFRPATAPQRSPASADR